MILPDTEVKERIESPSNLLNRLRTQLDSSNKKPTIIPSIPKASDIIPDLEDKIATVNVKTRAIRIINSCFDELEVNVKDLKLEKQAEVAERMARVINNTRDRDKEKPQDIDNRPQIHIYAPSFLKEEHFETIYVRE